jgi:hypothetical protein
MVVGAWCIVLGAQVFAQNDSLSTVRDLYASAAYEEALNVLGTIPAGPRSTDESRTIEQYRAFCLLALGRSTEAEHAIATVVEAQPTYRPVDDDMSPRVRAAFVDVRKRLLPTIIQQRYADAKAAFDRREFMPAAQGFQQVLDLMNDPDVAATLAQPAMSDMRVLARGFHDLSASAAAPPPLPAAPVAEPIPPPAPVQAAAPQVIYVSGDGRVTPPVPLHQELPAFPGVTTGVKQGLLEVVIDENGLVESAAMRVPVAPTYDALAIAATRTWRYKPAIFNGAPVKFRKAVQITVRTPGRP